MTLFLGRPAVSCGPMRATLGLLCGFLLAALAPPASALNSIQIENALPGTPASTWDITGAGDPSIQGFATDISVNRGSTVTFKIQTDAASYHIDIYRLGYYQGDGARLQGSGVVTATLPQLQPAPLTDAATGLIDCGNWGESAHWDVPATAVSGIYIARLVRDDTQGASHIAFIVRDDAATGGILFKTADATWQAYNGYGGNSLYVGTAPRANGNAAKVSYNRPFLTRAGGGGSGSSEDWLFNAEYPMVRWLEANGYDVRYTTDVDADRSPASLLSAQVLLTAGHDEYWSGGERAAFEAARAAGVHQAHFTGNEVYWKTRWEPSIDGSNTAHRTLVCYKEGTLGENNCGGRCDPLPGTWTGLWRDGCAFPTLDGCRPENTLTGQISWLGTSASITVPDTYKDLRFWRNTAVATLGAGQTVTLPDGTLGYEWDYEQFAASYPNGRIRLSSTKNSGQTHHLSLYRHAGGALVFGAGTVQWSWGLDASHDRAGTPTSLVMQQATLNLLADMGVQPETLQPGLVAATASADALAPSSVVTSPVTGASLPSGSAVTITGTATEAGGGVVAGVEVSLDGGATWQPATGTTAWSLSWTPGTLGAVTILSRGFDDSGNMELAGTAGDPNAVAVTVTTPPPPSCPCTVFQPTDAPATPAANDGQAIEVGMKFRSTVDGFVSAIRYYKGAGTTGTHVGHLWSATGAQLAEVAFTGETASGWQEATLSAPIAITANTTYVVSQHSSSGDYPFTNPFFTTALVNGPLRGLATGEDGPNAVYQYSATPAFPTSNFQSSNYYVDVVFTTSTGPDQTAPTVSARVPSSGASGIAVTSSISASFSEPLDPLTVTTAQVAVTGPGATPVPGTVSYQSGTRTAHFVPASALAYSTPYTVTLTGGPGGLADVSGNVLAANDSWTFTTAAPPPPPPTEGPGGPILVISSAANPFSRYPVEILRTEGLNAFTAMDLSLVTPAVLAAYDVVVLGECALSIGDVTMLSDWTDAGGTLIAFRPDAQLAPLMGLTPAGGTLTNGYLLVDTASPPGTGIVSQTMQFHGSADLYTLSGATAVATLYSNATTATPNPAVSMRSVGNNGGRAFAFTYDLARSVVYTRQGNPAWAGTKRDGQIEPIRSDDMFFGPAAADPQPDWVDFTKIAIPQADEQQRLLANAITFGNLHRKPLPRFWYLPKGLKAAIVMTGDDHGDAGMQPRFDIYRTQSPPGCSVDDWECVRATGYLYLGTAFTPAQATFYKDLGFEVSLHVNTNCARYTPAEYENFVAAQSAAFTNLYPDIPLVSNRNHCISFPDWSTTPEVESAHGIRFDTNYYYWPASWVLDRPGLFTGSGMPMRFAKLDGTLIDCYQATTQMPDEAGESFPAFCDALLDRANGPEGYYGVFTTNMHFDQASHAGSDAIVASAQARGVPVVSSQQMLTWLDGRNGSSFANLAWTGNQLSFTLQVGSGARNLRGMLPLLAATGQLTTLTRDGNPVAFTTETIKGVAYAFFPADAGAYAATYEVDSTPPVVSALTATPTSGTTATVTWTTDEPSDSQVDYGTSPASLTLTAGSLALVTSHTVSLSGLGAGSTIHFRVRSADAAANTATEPAPPAAPATFALPSTPCFEDATAADFELGTTGAGTAVSVSADGEVILAPAVLAEFTGTNLPAGWTSGVWNPGGAAAVAGGALTVDGARAYTTASFGPGRSLEFRATFSSATFQNIGFATDGDFNSPWVVIGQGSAPGSLYARMDGAGDVLLSTTAVGSAHTYRIDWGATSFAFSIDGVLVTTITRTIGGNMVPIASDFSTGGGTLSLDWLRLTPYAASGSFTSRVFDSGSATDWGIATWNAVTPVGTSLAVSARGGATSVPDGSWSAFVPVSNGGALTLHGRYLQYRADLATGDGAVTPVLADIAFRCDGVPDLQAPVISAVSATPGPGGVTADITWTTDEPADSQVDYGTSPGALSLSSSSAVLELSHARSLTGLVPSTTYYYRVTSADAQANSASSPAPPATLSFTTSASPPSVCAQDQTSADFGAGSFSNTVVTPTGDGAVALALTTDVDFSGSTLPASWASYDWPFDAGVGTATVAGGVVTLDGARIDPDPSEVGPGTTLRFTATFSGDGFQHIGFGAGSHLPPNEVYNITPWAMFSTQAGGSLKARTHNGGTSEDFTIPGTFTGGPHAFRIDWNAGSVDYWIDGTLVHSAAIAVPGPMRPAASDLNVGGGTVVVDALTMTPYQPSGTFTSRVHDGGAAVSWSTLAWTATVPPGTSLALEVRRGDTPVPDGTWTAFAPVASSGASIAGISRYLQYRASFATSVGGSTPELADVSVTCTPCSGGALDPISDLAVTAGTPAPVGGARPLTVTFTAPVGAASVVVYRAPFGGYPRYDDAGGSTPLTPSYPPPAPWQLSSITASGQTETPPGRDQWHYVAFWSNSCGVYSAASNRPAGVLDYVLADVTDGIDVCAGNGSVSTADLSLLGAHYGESLTGSEAYACLDVGPTSDGWITGRPLTDGQLEFEDLIMFGLQYGTPLAAPTARARPALASSDDLRLDLPATVVAGTTFEVAVRMTGAGHVQGVSVDLAWDAARVRPVQMTPGTWFEGQGGVIYAPRPGRIDAMLLGRRESGAAGEGVLATLTFQALDNGAPGVTLGRVEARDAANRPVALGGSTGVPPVVTRTAFERITPNPVYDRSTLRFSLAAEGPVELALYSVDGRLVRTVVRGPLAAGPHAFEWDRRDDGGALVGPGLYLARLSTRSGRFTHKLAIVR